MTKDTPPLYQLKATLEGTRPPVWRRLQVPGTVTLGELHRILQTAMGWTDSHLHMFVTGDGHSFGDPMQDPDEELGWADEQAVTLAELLPGPGNRLTYEYDFGDGWEHTIVLEKLLPPAAEEEPPRCTHAIGRCPPEDVGGVGGFQEFKRIMANPSDPEYEDTATWYGAPVFDADDVDLAEINDLLRLPAGSDECPFPPLSTPGLSPDEMHALLYHWFEDNDLLGWQPPEAFGHLLDEAPVIRMTKVLFEAAGEQGIKLTPKGNLPLVVVRAMLEAGGPELVSGAMLRSVASVRSETDVLPLHVTRILADLAGFTRKHKRRLLVKKNVQKRAQKGQWHGLYTDLLLAMMREFNWAYLDGYDEIRGIQVTAPYTWWLLDQWGDQWESQRTYALAILDTFPMLAREASDQPYMNATEQAGRACESRTFRLFRWFGLTEERETSGEGDSLSRILEPNEVRKTKLFERLLVFN